MASCDFILFRASELFSSASNNFKGASVNSAFVKRE